MIIQKFPLPVSAFFEHKLFHLVLIVINQLFSGIWYYFKVAITIINVLQYKPNVIAGLQAHGTDLSFMVTEVLQDWNVSQFLCELEKVLVFILPLIILNNRLNLKNNLSWYHLHLLLIL